jgi:hypothetical protein
MPFDLVQRGRWEASFIALAEKYNAEGLVEYLLWETIEGKRDRPYKLLDPLTGEELALLINLRDVAKIWLFWQDGQWCNVDVEEWRAHAEVTPADLILTGLHNRF